MRDIKRIEKILNLLSVIWAKYPDHRLGQLIVNITNPTIKSNSADAIDDANLFYLEDDKLYELLTHFKEKRC